MAAKLSIMPVVNLPNSGCVDVRRVVNSDLSLIAPSMTRYRAAHFERDREPRASTEAQDFRVASIAAVLEATSCTSEYVRKLELREYLRVLVALAAIEE